MRQFVLLLALVHGRDVVTVTSADELDLLLASSPFVFVNFGTMWCGQCKQIQKTWEQVAADLSDIVVAQVDCMMAGALCISQDITTFPQLILFNEEERVAIYPRHAPHGVYEFIDFVDQHRNPYSLFPEGEVVVLSDKTFSNFIMGEHMTVVMYHIDWCSPCQNMMSALEFVAEKTIAFKGDIKIATLDCGLHEDICVEQDAEMYPTFVAYRNGEELVGAGRWKGAMPAENLLRTVKILVDQKPIKRRQVFYDEDQEAADFNSPTDNFSEASGFSSGCNRRQDIFDTTKPAAETGCWTFDEAKQRCHIRNPECLVLDCLSDRMRGFLRLDALNDKALIDEDSATLTRKIEFNNGKGDLCTATFDYNAEKKGIDFQIRLGECGMAATSVEKDAASYIKFSQAFGFAKPPENDFRIFFENYFTSRFGFHCYYRASTSTKDSTYSVSTRIYNADIEKFVNWDSTFDLTFYDNSYKEIFNPASLIIGDVLYVRATWRQDFSQSFPVEFYINSCTISSGEASFRVIDSGCVSQLVHGKILSNSVYQTKSIDFRYVSFSFVQHQSRYDMRLQCNIKFCLNFDRSYGNCGMPKTCPTGYST